MDAEAPLVRASRPEDAIALAEIERRVSEGPWSLSQFISACRDDSTPVLVACHTDGAVAGFAIYSMVVDEATLLNIAVHPDLQGRGLGGCLLVSVLEQLRLTDCRRLLLEVRCSNAAAISLYRKTGFVDDGLRKDYYPTSNGREDALLMSLELAEEL